MLNDQYKPSSDNEEAILDALKEGGRLRPINIAERTGKTMSANNHYMRRLIAAGWVKEVEEGLYEIAYDPREMSLDGRQQLYENYADELGQQQEDGVSVDPSE